MAESVWWRLAPVWLRIVAGILLFPALWFGFALVLWVLLGYTDSPDQTPSWPFLAVGIAAALATWIIARKSSTPIALAVIALAMYALWWILSIIQRVAQALPEV